MCDRTCERTHVEDAPPQASGAHHHVGCGKQPGSLTLLWNMSGVQLSRTEEGSMGDNVYTGYILILVLVSTKYWARCRIYVIQSAGAMTAC